MGTTHTVGARMRAAVMATALAIAVVAVGATAASGASGTAPPDVSMKGTGPAPAGVGLLSKKALAQEYCDPTTGRMWFNYEGTGPFCVNPWPKGAKNGGATAPGVTATEVKVLAYLSPQAAQDASPARSAGQVTTYARAVQDAQEAYDYAVKTYGTYQQWGRTVVVDTLVATGTDETSQNADAIEAISRKPFIVVDLSGRGNTGAAAFSAAVAKAKIIVATAATTPDAAVAQRPYRWNYGQDVQASEAFGAALVGRSLTGKKAVWAGDKDLQSKVRVFGLVHQSDDYDVANFNKLLKQNGGDPLAVDLSFDPANTSRVAEFVPTMVNRLKSAGVTSVILNANPAVDSALLTAATAASYFPEWIITGYGYPDYDLIARSWDPMQSSHMFGLANLPPRTDPTAGLPFTWYWGTGQGAGNIPAIPTAISWSYAAIHYAGPNLTAANVEKGLFAKPASGGAFQGTTGGSDAYGNTAQMPYPEYSAFGSDRALVWFNPDVTGASNVGNVNGKGLWQYLDGAKRYTYATLPKSQPKFFDASVSVSSVPLSTVYVSGVVPPVTPCTGCPSQGGTSSANAS